eukprot:m51a1_g11477 hypothetical protein (371) ;mRNA; f:4421-7611
MKNWWVVMSGHSRDHIGSKRELWETAVLDSPLTRALLAALAAGTAEDIAAAAETVADSRGTRLAVAVLVRSACYAGSLDALAMLDRAPFMPVTLDAAEGGAALAGACGSGCIGVRDRIGSKRELWETAVLDSPLTRALLAALAAGTPEDIAAAAEMVADSRGTRLAVAVLVRSACYAGSLDALAMLDRAPFMPVTLDTADGGAALAGACGSGCVGVVRRLTRGPYWLGRAHAQHNDSEAFIRAVEGGHTDVVRELGQQPWAAGEAEDRVWIEWAVGQACASDNSALIDVLAGPPYNALQHEGEEMDHHIWTACCHGNREALYALFRHRRLKAAGFLRMACRVRSAPLVQHLSRPPYNMGHADAVADNCWL